MTEKLVIGYLYNKHLNLYGDNGNVEILVSRTLSRGISTEVREINLDTKMTEEVLSGINLVFMGGGPDSAQKNVYEDLLQNKKSFIKDFVDKNGVGLYVCGSYQLLGKYYKASDGEVLDGLGIFDLYTEHFGNKKPRCIGNTVGRLSEKILTDPVFINVNKVGKDIVGFENHGGRTYIANPANCLARVTMGHGNNSEDLTEGYIQGNSFGTYFHGPVLSRNPHLADYLIAKALGLETLKPLDDEIVILSHTASKKLKQ